MLGHGGGLWCGDIGCVVDGWVCCDDGGLGNVGCNVGKYRGQWLIGVIWGRCIGSDMMDSIGVK